MRKLSISVAIVAGLMLCGVNAYANEMGMKQTETAKVTQLSGKVTDVKGDSFMLKDQAGKTHKIVPVEPSELAEIKVGDNVTVNMTDGKAVAINKTDNSGNSEAGQGSGQ
jgi:hypothetical protein